MLTDQIRNRAVPLQISWGGGVNSTAMLVGCVERRVQPDVILFADTGGEKPETYLYRNRLAQWCLDNGLPPLTTVAKATKQNPSRIAGYTSLEDEALKTGTLPSRAFGFGRCADKWKIQPQDRFMRQFPPAVAAWKAGRKVIKAIGYDAGEERRAVRHEDDRYVFWHPLIEWGWDRQGCIAAIERAGLPVPPKSSCFFCPSSTKPEILELERKHPALLARALAMEDNAQPNLGTVKGLGRRFAWRTFIESSDAERRRFPEAPVEACTICQDGEED